ncbi:hypothetical protein N7492_001901 [Penicillium capsulatum]|uniref:Uncharacterized protein n=1 Tax=Penicillium capsulatum TaxID=69766 RepID=A0A9W9LUQ8_9EURO|nr:hypothetical protein N7492_001901 [Penicillium capsulatum]KAJ6123476.1 hypothetical protein N7512_005941 [Penicillium capsulatum]
MATSCHVDCLALPTRYEPDSDISGVGVVINYVVTAGLAVFIIFLYYVTVYDPSTDPFDAVQEGAPSERPNPLDDFLLKWLRSGPAYIAKRFLDSRQVLSFRTKAQLERVLIKCILLMGDLQIVTGLAILLSGFAQFECGLAALKWRIILDLSWFSCLTHLSCMTMLRKHLHTHTFQRIWRLIAMGILAAILAAGLLITANPNWLLLNENAKATPTICITGCYLEPGPNKSWVESLEPVPVQSWQPSEWFWTPVVSASFIVIAFISRIVRLHKTSSLVARRATEWLDGQMQRFLWALFRVSCTEGHMSGLGRSFLYRPIFGIFMILRFLLDSFPSFAAEVSWVFAAFLWGTWRLVKDLSPNTKMEPFESSKETWTFGQIVSVFTLTAPLISVIGTLEEEQIVSDTTRPTKQTAALSALSAPSWLYQIKHARGH